MDRQLELLRDSEGRRYGNLLRGVLGVLLVSGVALLAQAFVNQFLLGPYFFFFIPASIFTAWRYGFRSTLATILICTLGANFFFLQPKFEFGFDSPAENLALMFVTAASLLTGWIISRLNKKHQVALLAQRELAATLSSIGDAVLVVDRNKKVAFLNPIAVKLTGWSLDDARGRPLDEVFKLISKSSTDQLKNQQTLVSKDGIHRKIEETATPIVMSENGKSSGAVLVFRDITEREALEQLRLTKEEEVRKARDSAERARKELYTFFMQAPAPMVILMGPEHTFTLANPLYEKYVGRSVVGKTIREVFTNEEVGYYIGLLDRVYQSGEPFVGRDLPLTLKDPSGVERQSRIDVSYTPFRDEYNQIKGILVFVQDTTEQYLAREESARHTERLERLANSIPQIVYISDADGTPRFLNDRWYEFTGADRSSSVVDTNSYIHPDDLPGIVEAWKNAVENHVAFEAELRIKSADGSYRWFVTRTAPNLDQDRLIGWFGASTDIHDQIQKRSEIEFLNHVAQAYSQGLPSLRDVADTIVSLTMERFSGWAHVHLLEPSGRIRLVAVKHMRTQATETSWQYDERFPSHVNDPAGLGEIIRTGKTQYQKEILPDGFSAVPKEQRELLEQLNLKSSISVALKTTQKAFGVLTLVSDERHYTEDDVRIVEQLAERSAYAIQNAQLLDELSRAKDEAERANQLKSAFLVNMSHEIRTPLGAMLGFADLMRDPNLTVGERKNYIDILIRNGDSLSVIINDILDLSKVEAGHLSLEYTDTNPHQLVEEVVSLLRVKADEKNLRLSFVTEADVPRSLVTDPTRVRQVLLNLVGNAIKFTQFGEVKVRTHHCSNSYGRSAVCFDVSDTGIGVPSAQKERIFEMFVQADGSMTRRFGGTGLGLALSRRLAREMGGEIEIIETQEGVGTVFRVTIEDRPEYRNRQPDHPHDLARTEIGELSLNNVRILLVDDAPDNQLLIRRYLTKHGAIVESAENGMLGYRAALAGQHHVVLMDIQMPVMDGYTATQNLRDAGYRKPIIALTAHAMSEVRKKALNVGYSDHLTKPINSRELILTIAKHVSANQ